MPGSPLTQTWGGGGPWRTDPMEAYTDAVSKRQYAQGYDAPYGRPAAIGTQPTAQSIAAQQNREAIRRAALNAVRQKANLPPMYDNSGLGGYMPSYGGAPGYDGGLGVTTGITAQMPSGALDASRRTLLEGLGMQMSPQAGNALQTAANSLGREMAMSADTDFSRGAAFDLAGLQRDFEKARAMAGIGWGQLGAQANEMNLDTSLADRGLGLDRMTLLSRLLGGG